MDHEKQYQTSSRLQLRPQQQQQQQHQQQRQSIHARDDGVEFSRHHAARIEELADTLSAVAHDHAFTASARGSASENGLDAETIEASWERWAQSGGQEIALPSSSSPSVSLAEIMKAHTRGIQGAQEYDAQPSPPPPPPAAAAADHSGGDAREVRRLEEWYDRPHLTFPPCRKVDIHACAPRERSLLRECVADVARTYISVRSSTIASPRIMSPMHAWTLSPLCGMKFASSMSVRDIDAHYNQCLLQSAILIDD